MVVSFKIKGYWLKVDIDLVDILSNYADDTEAEAGGIETGQLYHTDGVVKIRLSEDGESPAA